MKHEPPGSVQRGENLLTEVCSVKVLDTRDGERLIRASWRGAAGHWVHMTWEWPSGHQRAHRGAEILAVITKEVGAALSSLELLDGPEERKVSLWDSTLWGAGAPADLLPPVPGPSFGPPCPPSDAPF